MKKNIFAVTVFTTMIVLLFALCGNTQAKVRMSRKNLTIEVSKTHTLKLKGAKGKIEWKSSKPGVAKVNKKGKVTALRKGKTTITARAGKKLYKCMIIVKDKKGTEPLDVAEPKTNEQASAPDKSTVKPEQPTATPYGPTSTPELSTSEPSEPTPVPTPDNSDSDGAYCGPCVMEYAAYTDCRISDIGEDFIEISDADGGVICRFIKHVRYSESEINKYYFDTESGGLEVVYDGKLTEGDTGMPLNSYDKVSSYAVKGDKINYSDIRIGDVVDVVYGYTLEVSVDNRKYECCGINVHSRSDSDDEYCGPAVQEYAAYMDCIISDIGEEFIEISDADGGVICRYIKHEPYSASEISKYYFFPPEPGSGSGSLEVVYDGELTEWDTGIPLNSYDKVGSYAVKGDKINYSDIQVGDVVDVVYEYTLGAAPKNRKYGCCGINVHKR